MTEPVSLDSPTCPGDPDYVAMPCVLTLGHAGRHSPWRPERGDPVTVGEKGETGARGPMGPRGPEGVAGADGLSIEGDPGTAGPMGPEGPEGPAGPPGPQGDPGPKGETGSAGPAGRDGAKGDQGVKGDTGATGAPGAAASPGLKGDKGDTGSAGTAGVKGDKGDTGATGAAGKNSVLATAVLSLPVLTLLAVGTREYPITWDATMPDNTYSVKFLPDALAKSANFVFAVKAGTSKTTTGCTILVTNNSILTLGASVIHLLAVPATN